MSMSPISLAWVLSLHYAAIKGVLHARRSSITFSLTSLALVSVLIYAWCVGLGIGRWINTCRLHPIWTGKWRPRRKTTQGMRVRIRALFLWQSSENKIQCQQDDSMFLYPSCSTQKRFVQISPLWLQTLAFIYVDQAGMFVLSWSS